MMTMVGVELAWVGGANAVTPRVTATTVAATETVLKMARGSVMIVLPLPWIHAEAYVRHHVTGPGSRWPRIGEFRGVTLRAGTRRDGCCQ
jgi:hypothetical protein